MLLVHLLVHTARPWDGIFEASWTLEGRARSPALLLIDTQEIFREEYGPEAIANMASLLHAFRDSCHLTVFKLWYLSSNRTSLGRWAHTHTQGSCLPALPLAETLPSTEGEAQRTVKTFRFNHATPCLMRALRRAGIDTVILAGGYTEHCVMATVTALFDADFDVVVASDAVGPSTRGDRTSYREQVLGAIGQGTGLPLETSRIVRYVRGLPVERFCPATRLAALDDCAHAPAPPLECGLPEHAYTPLEVQPKCREARAWREAHVSSALITPLLLTHEMPERTVNALLQPEAVQLLRSVDTPLAHACLAAPLVPVVLNHLDMRLAQLGNASRTQRPASPLPAAPSQPPATTPANSSRATAAVM